MIRKDYLVRQIEEFGKVLAALRELLSTKSKEDFEKEISEAVMKFSAIELGYVEAMDEQEFMAAITGPGQPDPVQKKMLADLLFEKMHYYLLQENEPAWRSTRLKCAFLYRHLLMNATQNEYNLDIHYKISYLETL